MHYKIDFHTHSIASPDGSLDTKAYERMLRHGLDYIAITDHNTITMAQEIQRDLGEHIIIGEEITTSRGEIVGLYLRQTIPAQLSPAETVTLIHEQGGLVYIPHPFETVRKGLSATDLEEIAAAVDIIELHNGRAVFQNKTREAYTWAAAHNVAGAASSDAHGAIGWGRTFTVLPETPTRKNLTRLLQKAEYRIGNPGVRALLYPKFNRLRKRRK